MGIESPDQRELRILRRVVTHRNKQVDAKKEMVRVEARVKGIQANSTATLVLYEVPPPDSTFASDVADMAEVALRHAQDRCERLGYSKLLGVNYDGKMWYAKLEI